ncbi:MAG: hypothetical protein ACPGJV_15965 [Bacteriovoracaceae bacterium]
MFGRNVVEGKLDEAAKVLVGLIGCSSEEAEQITSHYRKKFEESPNIIMQTMLIKSSIESGKNNEASMTIQNLFGASGLGALKILEAMKMLV